MTTATQCTNCGHVSNNNLPADVCQECREGFMVPLSLKCESPVPIQTIVSPETGRTLIVLPVAECAYKITITVEQQDMRETPPHLGIQSLEPDVSDILCEYLIGSFTDYIEQAFSCDDIAIDYSARPEKIEFWFGL